MQTLRQSFGVHFRESRMLVVARGRLHGRLDSMRPRRIIHHLQGFCLGPPCGRFVEKRLVRGQRNGAAQKRQRYDTSKTGMK